VRKFEGYVDSALAAGNAAAEWTLKWRGNADVAPAFAEQTNRFARAGDARRARDRSDKEKADGVKSAREASEIVAAYRGREASTEDCNARAAAWNAAWKPVLPKGVYDELSSKIAEALVDRRNRDSGDLARAAGAERRKTAAAAAEKSAVEQAEAIARRYSDENESVSVAKAEYAVWQNEWGRHSSEEFYARCRRMIDEAAAARTLADSGRAVAAECGRWLDNIWTVTSRDVRNWRSNIDRAELELKRAVGEGRISEKAAAEVRAGIDARRRWAVGVIDNKTHRTVEFGGKAIGPVSSAAVVFTNGVPEGVAVTSDGCEPYRVRESDFDSKVTVVMPKNLVERTGGAKARIPPCEDGVVCLVDGVERRPGVVDVRPGRHHVVWRRTLETYPGTRDYSDQGAAFDVAAGGTADVPPPSREWASSPEFESAKKNAAEAERARGIVARIEECLVPEPLETRRARLGKAYGIFADWRTSSTLAVLGEGVELDLKRRFEDEKARVRGYVRNATDVPAEVATDVGRTEVPPGESRVVTFEKVWSGQSYAALPDYEFVFLPRLRDDFDGKEFVIEKSRLVPLPVKVRIPPLEGGVTCEIGDETVVGEALLRPGEYDCQYRKPDCKPQKFEFVVRIGEETSLPPPKAWEPSGALSAFADALSSFASGAVDQAKGLTSKIGTIEDPEKRRELEELRRAIELREKLEAK